ncbi:MAG: class I SAM-dependent methyltransferase [Myxococcales bacterium]|nr:class I SAM-dependent methyltransferase [Myxococcales bacterium]
MTTLDRTVAAERLVAAQAELKWLIAEAALDVAGVFDPTPASDLAAAALALHRGDLWGAGLSMLGVVPYVGDAIGKTGKGARLAQRMAAVRHEVETLVEQMAKNPAAKATSHGPSGFALTDGGVRRLSRDLPLPTWATEFGAWKNKRVLDAGAGGGTFVRELRDSGVDAYGIDLVADTFKKAGIKHNDHFVQASVDRIPMADRAFDAACSNWSVFYYFDRIEGEVRTAKFLAEMVRVVKAGGEIRLFGVDPRAAAVIARSGMVRVERTAAEVSGVVPVMLLRVVN